MKAQAALGWEQQDWKSVCLFWRVENENNMIKSQKISAQMKDYKGFGNSLLGGGTGVLDCGNSQPQSGR